MAESGCTVVEHLLHDARVKGSSLAITIGKDRNNGKIILK